MHKAAVIASFTIPMLGFASLTFAHHHMPAAENRQRLSVDSTIAELLANRDSREILNRHAPHIANHSQLSLIRNWSLRRLATDPHSSALTLEALHAIEEDLEQLNN